jgi:formylglycine-generating enzyme required for sulfatase activity
MGTFFFASVIYSDLLAFQTPEGALIAMLPNDVSMEFVRISPGKFMMGCSKGDLECFDNEKPAHLVQITHGYEIGKYEVTSVQWQAVMITRPLIAAGGDDSAVGFVTSGDADEFINRLNALNDGYKYRLPTEAEWEYAARAGSTGAYAGRSLDAIAWYGQNATGKPYPVGKKEPNAWGLFDTQGNVWEWVQDSYASDYYENTPTIDPKGPPSGQYRVLRGGSCFSNEEYARVSVRYFVGRSLQADFYGFRVVREATRD